MENVWKKSGIQFTNISRHHLLVIQVLRGDIFIWETDMLCFIPKNCIFCLIKICFKSLSVDSLWKVFTSWGTPNISPCLFTFAVIKNQRLGPVLEIEQDIDLTTIPKLEALLLDGDDSGNLLIIILIIFSYVPYISYSYVFVRLYYINKKLYCRILSSLMFEKLNFVG